ncbi:MAG TPA: hypothetical protein VMD57_00450 [Candidatus Baltobacteraceae bacterium]|nr:hypothetical protein [Candidatus Baltobacteraceae bacterium]
MKRSTRTIFIVGCVTLGLVTILFLTKKIWIERLIETTAMHYQHLPGDIDTVEVFTLEASPNGNTDGFAGDFDSPVETVGHKTLTGSDAQKITNLWRQFPTGRKFQALCFEPAYGLEFKRKGKIYLQTSVCWRCAAFSFPFPIFGTVQYGFDAKSSSAQELLKTLEDYLPLPPEKNK